MSFWSKFPILRLALFFAAGIILAHIYGTNIWLAYSMLVITLLLYIVFLFYLDARYYHKLNAYIGILACINMCIAGYINYANTDKRENDAQKFDGVEAYRCISKEDMHNKEKVKSVLVYVTHVYKENLWVACTHPKAHLYISKTSSITINYGDILLVQGTLKFIEKRKQKEGLDFHNLAKISQVYYQSYVTNNTISIVGNDGNKFYRLIYKLLRYSKEILNKFIQDKSAYAIVCALLLGDKDALDSNLRQIYTESGTMHVLAVSGLHVGVLYILLMWFISFLKLGIKANLVGEVLSIFVLWFYAACTGFSASVLRATTMFSIVGMSKLINRHTNIYNSLGVSALILLLVNPRLLFNLGFQLSYLAVFGIAYLTDKVYGVVKLKNIFLDKLWLLTSVSLSAQIATIPLTLHYFGQFPTYFIVANWVVVPLSALILYLGMALLITGKWAWLATKIGYFLKLVVVSLNKYLTSLQQLPYNLIGDIYTTTLLTVIMYANIIVGLIFLYNRNYLWLLITLLLFIIQLTWWVINIVF